MNPRYWMLTTSLFVQGRYLSVHSCKPLEEAGIKVTLVGGADVAAELDAKRAINQASRLAAEV